MRLEVVAVGPQKTGTTWLYECLRKHPQLCFPQKVKETFFLDERSHKGWSWYWAQFDHRMDGQLCAEIGPSYFDVPEAGGRLRDHNPDCRIIISLRDPLARSFSLYLHHKRKGRLNCSFREAIQKMPRIIDSSRYRKHISRWAEMFGMERILVILLEDISSSPALVLERVYDFIGIARVSAPSEAGESVYVASLPHSPALARLATNGAGWLRDKGLHGLVEFAKGLGLNRVYTGFRGALPALEPGMRTELVKEFEPDIAYVEELLGQPLLHWR